MNFTVTCSKKLKSKTQNSAYKNMGTINSYDKSNKITFHKIRARTEAHYWQCVTDMRFITFPKYLSMDPPSLLSHYKML